MRIEERLKKPYIMVLSIATIAAIVSFASITIVSANYKSAMDNYALPRGENGQVKEALSQCRSATRGLLVMKIRNRLMPL